MDNYIQKTLTLLGLSQKQIDLFETSFKLGPASVAQVAKAAGLRRSTAYLLIADLKAKGLLIEDLKNYKKRIFTIDPQKLTQIVAQKSQDLKQLQSELLVNLPALQAHYQASEIRPRVRVYEGTKGLFQVWQDILSTRGELLLWTNQQTDNLVFGPKKHLEFIAQRIKNHIPIRVLAVDNPEGHLLQNTDSTNLRQTKILPPQVSFSTETYIYDHKIAILDYNKDIIGIIIESLPIASSYRAIFDLYFSAPSYFNP